MKHLVTAQLLLLSYMAFAGDQPAKCELARRSVVSHSSAGLAQVSNLGEITITCTVPARPYAWGDKRTSLKVTTNAYQVLSDGNKELVPSEVSQSGASFDAETESVLFDFHIPLDSAERDAEADRILAVLERSMPPEKITPEVHRHGLEQVREFIGQHRIGHFKVKCRIQDGDRIMGVGAVELEVLFKGRVSDAYRSPSSNAPGVTQ